MFTQLVLKAGRYSSGVCALSMLVGVLMQASLS